MNPLQNVSLNSTVNHTSKRHVFRQIGCAIFLAASTLSLAVQAGVPIAPSTTVLSGAAAGEGARKVASSKADQSYKADPFAGDIWHAVKNSWPGTLVFDGQTKKVTLQPMGGRTIEASYAYTVKPDGAVPGTVRGTLIMTASDGKTSQAEYVLDKNRELTLTFIATGGMTEHYLRMTPAEEEAAKTRLRDMMDKRGAGKNVAPSGK